MIDSQPTRTILGELDRHNFTSGGTFTLGKGTGADGTGTIDIPLDRGTSSVRTRRSTSS